MIQKEFYSRRELSDYFGPSITTIKRDEKKMRELIPAGIYSLTDFCGTRIRRSAYQHFKNHEAVLRENPKYVEPFDKRASD